MTYIDIHSHIVFYPEEEIKKIIQNAKNSGVGIIIDNGVDKKTNRKILALSEKYPEIKPALGLYPTDSVKLTEKEIKEEIEFIRENSEKIFAIGEVGLDLKENTNLDKQIKIFEKVISLAKELDKPLIVHSRKAEEQTIEVLEKSFPEKGKIIMHCFSGKKKFVKRIIDNGWFLSIPTNVKSSNQFQEMIEMTPIEQLFCETDSPFLHPDKERNNEPKNVIESYKKIADIKKINLKEIEKKIEENFKNCFYNKR